MEQARRIARHLAGTQVLLPDGAPLTVAALQSLGGMLGYSTGSDELHYLLEGAFDGDRIGDAFLHDVYGRRPVRQRAAVRGAARGLLRARGGDPVVGAADPGRVR